jgi:hypothetical protein
MKGKLNQLLIGFLSVLLISPAYSNTISSIGKYKILTRDTTDVRSWKEEKISAEQLAAWKLLGQGQAGAVMGGQTLLSEADVTKGVMLISPSSYGKNVIMKYKILALTDASVFVNILSATDRASDKLTIPDNYDGSMDLWTSSKNYFLAFKNATHGATPFIKKNAEGSKESWAAEQDKMVAGVYYDIEAGKSETKLWLAINGKKIVELEDNSPLNSGRLAFRLRGLPGFKAACLIKDLKVYSK